jgi:NADPH:quinone reductase-like Zn-dependent oxidoreductase
MRAAVLHKAGGPDVLQVQNWPTPEPREGEVRIRVKAFGLNRAELLTRQGDSGSAVVFPRVIGIECTGEVIDAPGTNLVPGERVAAMMGGMGRAFDGSYAEVTRVPRMSVYRLRTDLPWEILGALPEMFQTSQGSLRTGLRAKAGEALFIRGGTSSIGLCVAALAKRQGLKVASSTRNRSKREALTSAGVDHVVMDDGGSLKAKVAAAFGHGADCVLDLVGTATLRDSLQCCRDGGRVCMTGILGGEWIWKGFEPLVDVPNGVFLTSYDGGSEDVTEQELQEFVNDVEAGRVSVSLDRTFSLDEIVDAHVYMEANQARGKLVVLP